MKKLRSLLCIMLFISVILSLGGCYIVSAQKMDKVKGTYRLTHYTYTPSYERNKDYVPEQRDYVNGEQYKFEDYLIITGTGSGYYVHKDANSPAYVKEITLSYEYSAEEPSKIEYVIQNDAISKNDTSGVHKLGVNDGVLNYSKPAIDYTQLFTDKPMRSESLSISWQKVDDATDLSYAEEQLGSLKYYNYDAFARRGVYELNPSTEVETGNVLDYPYQYYFYVIDTAKGVTTANVYYALKDNPNTQIKETITLSAAEDWSSMTLGGVLWTADEVFDTYYYNEKDGIKNQLTCISSDISDSNLEYIVNSRYAVPE